MGRLGFLQFGDDTIKVTRNMEANTKIFALLYSTKDGETLDVLIGKAVVSGNENEDLKNFIKEKLDVMNAETKTNNYKFYVSFDNKKYFEIQSQYSSTASSSIIPSSVIIAVPYNNRALTAQASLIEW
jgi:hypothetical protein